MFKATLVYCVPAQYKVSRVIYTLFTSTIFIYKVKNIRNFTKYKHFS